LSYNKREEQVKPSKKRDERPWLWECILILRCASCESVGTISKGCGSITEFMSGYPNLQEKAAIAAAERLMIQTMARYDPSHDKYHG